MAAAAAAIVLAAALLAVAFPAHTRPGPAAASHPDTAGPGPAPVRTAATVPPTTVPGPLDVPAGSAGYRDGPDGFAVAVPAAWKEVDPSSPAAAATVQAILQANPALGSVFGSGLADLVSRGVRFVALDPSATTGLAPNFNVAVRTGRVQDLSSVASALAAEYAGIGARVDSIATARVGGRAAVEAVIDLPLQQPGGGTATGQEHQYFVAGPSAVYVLTFAGTTQPVEDRITGSFATFAPAG